MSNFKVMLHRIFSSTSRRSQEQLLAKLQTVAKLTGGVWSKSCVRLFNDKLAAMKNIGLQCNVIAAHRIRRSGQILRLYHTLYGKTSPVQFFRKLGELMKKNPEGKMFFLLGAAFFDWNENRVSDPDLNRAADELKAFFDLKITDYHDKQGETWEKVHDEDHFKLWRCPVAGSSLYKYKVFGSYKDIPARAFFNIQLDLEYRKTWDSHVVRLEKIEEDEETGSEVIYWATQFPLGFLYNRDYVYVRRSKIDQKNNLMMLTAKSVDHPSFPVTKDYIRVGQYTSNMLIRPHRSFDENGFDYVMSYYDDPQLYVPTWAINKMTLSSLPSFLETLHKAARQLSHTKGYISRFHPEDSEKTGTVHSC
ncbi:stAR-related lipid transfer protein 7, mitochondrial-like [Mercenaria mercenaria]|uniref:stAR-related lipid transfer protein 7, mitochondrial-like n=1 Tax=Mercenaria mercenaria TaxID=6596 RepID=UPI00234F464F|nr:stAR-related lipid transfer protein 7, mitochondrial-like [Mercenaria mercenaria]